MTDWTSVLPVAGTLLGAAVAGGITLLVQLSGQKHARRVQELQLREERARWAAERELDQIQRFYALVDHLKDRMTDFRIARAWAHSSSSDNPPSRVPDWVPDESAAQDALDRAYRGIYLELPLLFPGFAAGVESISEAHRLAGHEIDGREEVRKLQSVEDEIWKFKLEVAKRYREVFDARRSGSDRGQ